MPAQKFEVIPPEGGVGDDLHEGHDGGPWIGLGRNRERGPEDRIAQVIGDPLSLEKRQIGALEVAFAPAERPRIAVAVIVENGGFGASLASPIARQVMDTYLLDANGQLKEPLPPGTVPLTPGPGYGPIIQGKGLSPAAAAPPKEDAPVKEAED